MEFQPDVDHSYYQAFDNPVHPVKGSWGQELLKQFPQHERHGVLCVDGNYPLISNKGVSWVLAGIIDQYPILLRGCFGGKNEWVFTPKEEATDEMKKIENFIITSDFYKDLFKE